MKWVGKEGIVFGAVALFMLGVLCGILVEGQIAQERAVESGHAEFYVDESGKNSWRWLERCDGR